MNWAIEEKSYSQRRACGLIGLDPKTYRYASRRSDEVEIRVRLKAVADQRRRFTSPSIAHQTWAKQTTLYTLDEQLLVLARSASCPAEQVFVAGILSRGVPPREWAWPTTTWPLTKRSATSGRRGSQVAISNYECPS